MSDEHFRRLGANYLRRIRAGAPSASRIVNKTTENFRFAGLIALALPNARILHVRRDPVDTCFSCFSTLFAENLPYAYDLAELGRYYRAYEALMDHWRDALPHGMMIDVQYEDVVADLEGQAAASSTIAASSGTRAASNSRTPTPACAPPASPKCAGPFTRVRLDGGVDTRRS